MKTYAQKRLIYGIMGTLEQVLVRQGKRAISGRAIEVLLYIRTVLFLVFHEVKQPVAHPGTSHERANSRCPKNRLL